MASDINNESEEEWDSHDNQYQELHSPDTIINNKSTKEIYKAVAKQWGKIIFLKKLEKVTQNLLFYMQV